MRYLILALIFLSPLPAFAQASDRAAAETSAATMASAASSATAGEVAAAAPATAPSDLQRIDLALDDNAVKTRLTDIRQSLENRRKHADYWFYGFTSFYAATAVGQAVIGYYSDSEKIRAGNYVGAITSLLGVSGMLISPIPTGSIADKVQALPQDSPEARQASLQEAERMLAETQTAEVKARRWTEHALGFLVSGSAAAYMYFRYDDWENALMKIGSGIAFGQTRPLTGPIAHHDFWPSYEPGTQLPASVTSAPPLQMFVTPKGVMASYSF